METEIKKLLNQIQDTEGCDRQFALRDLLTQICHFADDEALDFEKAVEGAIVVATQEAELLRMKK